MQKTVKVQLKSSFNVVTKIEAFYTGGKFQLSKDGEYCFCSCGDKVQLVETSTGRIARTIQEDEDELSSFVVSPDDKILVTVTRSLLLRQWDWKDQKVVRRWKALHRGPVVSMVFDKTSTLLATGSSDSTIKIWDVVKEYCTHNFKGSKGVVNLIEFHPDPEKLLLFSAADDCKIRLWDLITSKCISILDGHFSSVTSFGFADENKYLISSGRDKVVIIWDIANRSSLKTLPVFESLESILVLPKDLSYPWCTSDTERTCYATVGERGILRVWSFPDGRCLYANKVTEVVKIDGSETTKEDSDTVRHCVVQATVCENLGCIVTATYDHNLLFYDLKSLKRNKQLIGHYDEILDIRFIGENSNSLAVATNSPQVKIVDVESLNCSILSGHSDIVLSIDVSFDGKYIASSSKDNTVRIWRSDDQINFRCVAVGFGHTQAVSTVSWPKISTDYLTTGSEDLTLKYWEVPPMFKEDVALRLSVKWTIKAHDKDINSIAVSPNDKLIATGSQDKSAKVWMASNGTLLGTMRGHRRGIWCVVFSPVDQCLATASADSTVKIWALSDFTCVKTFEEHTNSVLKVQFISRGMQLVSSGSDGLVKLWTIRSNECVKTLDEHSDRIWSLAVNKKEDFLVTGGADSVLNIWKDVTQEEIDEERSKQDDVILKEQELSNLLQEKKFVKAIGLAIRLEQPFRVLTIFRDMLNEMNGKELIGTTVTNLRTDQLGILLKFISDWNTNAKHSYVAQTVLSIILKAMSPEELMEFPNIKETIETLIPYTERHFNRMDRLLQQASFLDFTWHSMRLSAPQTDNAAIE